MIRRILLVAFALVLPAQAQEQNKLQERKDVVSWNLLAQVELVKMKDRYVPQFSSDVAALDQKVVKLQGFIVPLAMGDGQTHFILSAMPITCPFCVPAGAESLVEVKSKKPVRFTFEPVIVRGKLAVLRDDPLGVFYRIVDAEEAN